MLTFKRSLIIAGLVLFFFFVIAPRRTHDSPRTASASSIRGALRGSDTSTKSTKESLRNTPAPSSGKKYDTPKSSEKPKDVKSKNDGLDVSSRLRTQAPLGNMKEQPLRVQLAYQYPYDVSVKFPAFIWQTWKYTPADPKFGEKFRPAERSWTEQNPDFIHETITDNVAVHLIRHLYSSIPDVLEAYMSMPAAIYKADFFRYLILFARGGIYSDIDTYALKPATKWIHPNFKMSTIGLVVGIEADPDRPDWADWYSRRIQFCQWTIQAKPGHPVLREIISKITEETLRRKRKGILRDDHAGVVEFTGPAIWTDTVFEYMNDKNYFDLTKSAGKVNWANFTGMKEERRIGDVVVLPITSFSPGIGHSGAGEPDDHMAFVKHEFEGTWKPASEQVKPIYD